MGQTHTQALLNAVRQAGKPALWAQGMKLARIGAALLERRQGAEYVFRVKTAGRPVPFTVYLTPPDAWECSCDGVFEPCEHIVAAAVTLAQHGDDALHTTDRWIRLVYCFTKVAAGLTVTRELLHPDGRKETLSKSLQSMRAGGQLGMVQLEDGDLLADKLLERPWRGALTAERLQRLIGLLDGAKYVLLEGQQVVCSNETVFPRVRLEDDGTQVLVTIHADPRISELLSPGVARCSEVLCCLGEAALSGAHLENLPNIRRYDAKDFGALMNEVLPKLAERLPFDNHSKLLPRIDRTIEVHVELKLTQLDTGLTALPTLVYGSPACARIDGDVLKYLGGPMPLRDKAAETKLTQQLRATLNMLPGRRATFHGPEAAHFINRLRHFGGILKGDAQRILGSNITLAPHVEASGTVDAFGVPQVAFNLRFSIEGGPTDAHVSAETVLRAWQDGVGLVPCDGNGWASLPQGWLDAHGSKLQQLLDARTESGPVANHALPVLAELCESLETPPPPGLERLKALYNGSTQLPPAVLPDDLQATLRPYQRHGVDWLDFLKQTGLGGILADDMGLGKTLQTICCLEKTSLVVCPASLLANWKAELSRFRPSLSINVYHGPGRSLLDVDVTLTSYALLRLDVDVFAAKTWRVLILDEAQAIKNAHSQAAKAACRLQGTLTLAITGTPLENRIEELWSLMHFANPGLLGNQSDFARTYDAAASLKARHLLQKKMAPFILRRLKRDVAPELPARSEAVHFITLTEAERTVYDAVHAATRTEIVTLLEKNGNILQALEALLRLRQASCHSALVPGQHATTSSKVEALQNALSTAVADGHRCLVFSQWTTMLNLIEPTLHSAQIKFSRLDGTTKNRGALVEQFQAEEGPSVMLLSLKAGGTGLTLTAADHVFLMDPWWNPQIEAQAADRTHRIGQRKPVFVYRLIAQGTIEERMLTLQEKKRTLFEAALGGSGEAAKLTKDDLLNLLS